MFQTHNNVNREKTELIFFVLISPFSKTNTPTCSFKPLTNLLNF